ncbi:MULTISPECIES: ApeA N-terminal domain 1-containing protein [Haloferax]|uniref:Uncharacterized protein n=1 Tax=Haloferax massiliensis TaxID=1476858 RepID=A0A0D6JVS9_9EURY|nr:MULTISPECIES: HEPN domain-containing protein [Haloferax]MDS0242347.1 hypothetical protein [Haloferax sp. S2CR25]MDS0445468.1 hypothetical protein [Haloferax sp. S2CR25-2]CQR53235.1 hypothetical protein BN996_03532 [Haloferax massiliensis]
MESFQGIGDWWVPGSPKKISGEVSFSPVEGVTLDLNGKLPVEDEVSQSVSRQSLSKSYPILYGDLGRDGPVTIHRATISSASFGGSESESYSANRMFVGDHISDSESFVRLNLHVDEIPDWTGDSTIRPIIDKKSIEESTIRPIIDKKSIEESTIIDDIEAVYASTESKEYTAEFEELQVKFSNSSRISSKINSVEMETVGVLQIGSGSKLPLRTFFEYGNHALAFLSFAVGTRIYPDKAKLYTDIDEQPINIYYSILDHGTVRSPSKSEYLFRPADVDFETALRSWVDNRETAPEVHDNYSLLLNRSNLPPRLRFLIIVIALEAYYDTEYQSETHIPEEEFNDLKSEILQLLPDDNNLQNQMYGLLENVANTPSIKSKLTILMESEQNLIEVFFNISDLASEARNQRNSVAHGTSAATPKEFYALSKKLQLVLEAILARRIGVEEDVLLSMLASRHKIG